MEKFRGFVLLKDDPTKILVGCVEHLDRPEGFVEFKLMAIVTSVGWSSRPASPRFYIPHENVRLIGVSEEKFEFGKTPHGWFDRKGMARL